MFLVAFGFGIFRLVYAGMINLTPQEAYYWVMSLHPDFSYFDHPPLAAYSIRIFTLLWGDTILGIRLPAILYGVGTTWVLFLLAKKFFGAQVAGISALLLNLTLGFLTYFLFITPDSPLIFFWALTILFVWKAVGEKRRRYWHLAGISWGLALLSKYTALFLGFSTFLWLLSAKDLRRELKRRELYFSVLLAFLVFAPVLIWNYQNHWVSFLFQTKARFQPTLAFSIRDLSTFVISQAGFMNPLLFAGFIAALFHGMRHWGSALRSEEKFLIAYAIFPLAVFLLAASQMWVKVNWPIPAYLSLVPLLVAYYQKRIWPARWVRKLYVPSLWGLALILFLLAHLIIPWKTIPVSSSADTVSGWPEAAVHAHKLKTELSARGPTFIWAWDHKTAAELQFYLPQHEPVFSRNLIGMHANAYEFWGIPRELEGRDALFVWSTIDPLTTIGAEKAAQVFDSIRLIEPFDVYRGDRKIRTFHFFHCVNYQPSRIK
jgi:4-amino-4-deoxy-L-arabinose transferase-like glycosyltransferase